MIINEVLCTAAAGGFNAAKLDLKHEIVGVRARHIYRAAD